MFLLTFVSFLIKNALMAWFFMNKVKKMKKRLYLLLILSVLFLKSGIAQVAKIKNEFISKNDIILIGPLNVDAYFPEQSNIYISKYERIIDELNSLINDFESELAYLDHKRIKNKFEINQIYKVIEKFNFELELLNDFILFWEEHDLTFNAYNDDFRENFKRSNCYSYIIGGETYANNEIEVVEVGPETVFEYYEFIDGDYFEVFRIYGRVDYDKSKHDSKCIIRIKGSPKELMVCDSEYRLHPFNVLEKIENFRKPRRYIQEESQKKLLDEDDQEVLIRTEILFPQFRFDKGEKAFYKERKYDGTSVFFQLWLKSEDRQVIPDDWFVTNCN